MRKRQMAWTSSNNILVLEQSFYSLRKEKLNAKKKEAVHKGLSTRTCLSITMSGVSRQKIRRDWMDLEAVAARCSG
jgi:hypothetical protein